MLSWGGEQNSWKSKDVSGSRGEAKLRRIPLDIPQEAARPLQTIVPV